MSSDAASASCGSEKVICLAAGRTEARPHIGRLQRSNVGLGFSRVGLFNLRQNPRPQIRRRSTIAIRSRGNGHEMQFLQNVAALGALGEVRRALRVFGW